MSDELAELSPELHAADLERKRVFRELLSLTAKVDVARQDRILFGGTMSRALSAIAAFRIHRELLTPGPRNTWWHLAWDTVVADWRKSLS